MRGEPAWWMDQRQGADSALKTQRVAPLTSWWIGIPRERWLTAVARRWGRAAP
jgi:hypothetical protein